MPEIEWEVERVREYEGQDGHSTTLVAITASGAHVLKVGDTLVQRIASPCSLSSREIEVLRLLGQGKVYKQIAAELQLSRSTIRTHLFNIYRKLGVTDRAQAVLLAKSEGWI